MEAGTIPSTSIIWSAMEYVPTCADPATACRMNTFARSVRRPRTETAYAVSA